VGEKGELFPEKRRKKEKKERGGGEDKGFPFLPT
jgi:hypothetical protein